MKRIKKYCRGCGKQTTHLVKYVNDNPFGGVGRVLMGIISCGATELITDYETKYECCECGNTYEE